MPHERGHQRNERHNHWEAQTHRDEFRALERGHALEGQRADFERIDKGPLLPIGVGALEVHLTQDLTAGRRLQLACEKRGGAADSEGRMPIPVRPPMQ